MLETFAIGCLAAAVGALGIAGWVIVRTELARPANIRALTEANTNTLALNDLINERVVARANRDEKVVNAVLESMGIREKKPQMPDAPPDPGIRQTGRVDDLHEQFRERQRMKRDGDFDARDRVSTEI